MKKIDFTFTKNNKIVINKKNINCLKNSNLSFIVDKDKYILNDNIFIKETTEEIITLDFARQKCIVFLKKENLSFEMDIKTINVKKTEKNIEIEYIIETEEDTINIISIEYKKSS